MNTLIQHAKLAIRMNNNGINREFIKKFPIEEIIDCCNRIEQNKILNDEYKDNEVIQEEIIKDEKFIHYLNIAYKKDLDMVGFEELLIAIKQHNEKMTDYSIKDILNVLYNKELFYKSYYDYLKYFRNESISLKKRITNNLNHFHCQSDIEFNELSENERKLVTLLDLDDKNLIPTNVIKEIYELLSNNEELRNIIDFLNAHSLYIQLDEQDYAESHYQNNSRVIKIEHLKTFFDYLFNIKHTIFKEPFKKINSERKLEKKLPNYLSLDEAKRLINLYENSTDEIEIRDNAMLHIFLNCGLRLSEIKNLNIEDINLDDNKFTIIGKGNKERTNYLNKKTKDALIKYLKIRDNSHDNNKKHNNALFLTFYGYRMSQFTINKIVKRAYRKAELDENVYTVHTLRHTCATLLYRSGVNIKTIQELLGHVHIDTTEIYTHLDNQEVKDVMFEHPLAQFKMEDALAYCA